MRYGKADHNDRVKVVGGNLCYAYIDVGRHRHIPDTAGPGDAVVFEISGMVAGDTAQGGGTYYECFKLGYGVLDTRVIDVEIDVASNTGMPLGMPSVWKYGKMLDFGGLTATPDWTGRAAVLHGACGFSDEDGVFQLEPYNQGPVYWRCAGSNLYRRAQGSERINAREVPQFLQGVAGSIYLSSSYHSAWRPVTMENMWNLPSFRIDKAVWPPYQYLF